MTLKRPTLMEPVGELEPGSQRGTQTSQSDSQTIRFYEVELGLGELSQHDFLIRLSKDQFHETRRGTQTWNPKGKSLPLIRLSNNQIIDSFPPNDIRISQLDVYL